MPNDELKSNLTKAKTRPYNFVIATKGVDCTALMLKRKKIIPADIADVRRSAPGSQAATGVCGPGDGVLTFWFADVDSLPTDETRLKKFVKGETGLTLKLACKIMSDDGLSDDPDAGFMASDTASEPEADDPDFDDALDESGADDRAFADAPDADAPTGADLDAEWRKIAKIVGGVVRGNPDQAAKIVPKVKALKAESDAVDKDDPAAVAVVQGKVVQLLMILQRLRPAEAPVGSGDPVEDAITVALGGDRAKLALFERQFGGAKAFRAVFAKLQAKRAEKGEGNIANMLETAFFRMRAKDAPKREAEAATRRAAAIAEARVECGAAGAKHYLVVEMAARLKDIEAEYAAAGLDDPAASPDLRVLELKAPKSVGDAVAKAAEDDAGEVPFRDRVLQQEPIIIVAAGLTALLAEIGRVKERLSKKTYFAYKDSRTELENIAADALALRDRVNQQFNAAAPKPGRMDFAEQNMVPSAGDLDAVEARLHATDGLSDPSQAWALVAADAKGENQREVDRLKSLAKLKEYNAKWGTSYDEADLDRILSHITGGRITTNYDFDRKPGANLDKTGEADTQMALGDLLMRDTEFRNVWEIGASQASTDLARRGGVEEQMGYSTPLQRTAGTEHTVAVAGDSAFDPDDADKGVMPKYGSPAGDFQTEGGASRYGKSFVVWKREALEARTTFVPGDSWNTNLNQGVEHFSGASNPELLFTQGEEGIIRCFAAEATGKDQAFLTGAGDFVARGQAYIEAQIHGELTWEHVDEIIIGEDGADAIAAKFQAFGKEKGYDFTVRTK